MDIQIDSNMRGVIAAICLSSLVSMGGSYVNQRDVTNTQTQQIEMLAEGLSEDRVAIKEINKMLITLNLTLMKIQTVIEVNSGGQYGRPYESKSRSHQFPYSPTTPSGWSTESGDRGRDK